MSHPPLFEAAALARRRARVAGAEADFVHRQAAAEVQERLIEVNRSFTAPAIVGPMAGLWADLLGLEARLVADADVLDLETGAHDLVIHALALHWANDPVGQLVQMRRALRPDGLAIAVLFGGRSLQELRAALAEAESTVRGGISPRVAPMGDLRDLGALLQRAGLALPVADSVPLEITYADLPALMRDLRAMGETNVMAARERRFLRRDVLAEAGRIYAAAYPAADGRIRATAEFVFLTGWAPAPDQPQPLRPGSAKARLADALRVPELSAGDVTPRPRPDD
ncbi:MAG: methyltransferase domain-containing protein [Pseudomonadota bacterium]